MFTYRQALAPGESTPLSAIVGFYLNPSVDFDHATGCLTINGESTNLALMEEGVGIPVSAQCISDQTAWSNLDANPWDNYEGLLGLLKRLFRSLGIG